MPMSATTMDTCVSAFVKGLPHKRTLPGSDYITKTDNEPVGAPLKRLRTRGLYYREKALFHVEPAFHERQTSGAPANLTICYFLPLR